MAVFLMPLASSEPQIFSASGLVSWILLKSFSGAGHWRVRSFVEDCRILLGGDASLVGDRQVSTSATAKARF